MVPAASLPGVQVESAVYPPLTKPPGCTKTFFLAGAGERGLMIQGKMVNVTAIGVYLEDDALPSLAVKWRGKSAEELFESNEFFRDVIKGPFEKFIQVTPFLPLSGYEFAAKLSDKLIGYWKSVGLYTDAEAKAIEKYMEAFTDEKLPSGSSILFGQSPCQSIMIGFSKLLDDGSTSLPERWNAVVENKLLSEGVLDTMIGEEGVSPATKQSVATRLAKLLKEAENDKQPTMENGKESMHKGVAGREC